MSHFRNLARIRPTASGRGVGKEKELLPRNLVDAIKDLRP